MRILITGATGFIGTNLCLRLLKEQHEILGVDNFYSSTRTLLPLLTSFDNFTFIEHDIIQPLTIPDSFVPDMICNLACPASPVHYLKDPIYTTKTSILGIINMLELANTYNIPILQASTSEVYGDPLVHPQEEQYWGNVNPCGIRSCYDEGKRVAESLCFDNHRMHNTKIKIIRIFNTYGPYMRIQDGRVVSNFITQALQGIPITVYGTGEQTRSFCYIDDLIEGIVQFVNLDNDKETGPINLGNPNEISINELVTMISQFIPNTTVVHKPLPSDDPQRRCPDISTAKTVLQWSPTISLQEGMEKTIEWIRTVALPQEETI